MCNNLGVCECASGFTGGDCSVRSCPSGSAFSDIAESADTAHQSTVCSGRGDCVAGNCACNNGFTGIACERSKLARDVCFTSLFLHCLHVVLTDWFIYLLHLILLSKMQA